MTSKIKVDNINKVSDDSNIIKKCGTTTTIGSGASNPIVVDGSAVTLGRCGGTVALASGATQTGFGRTGTVDWQTGSIKTSTFTAANGEGYFANTSGGAFTMNLPAGTAGNIVSVVDYTNTFQTNNLTIAPNGSQKIGGTSAAATLSTEGQSVTLVYVDDTEGWKNTQDSTSNIIGNPFVTATGGTITTSGNFKIHTFTGPGTFTVTNAGSPSGSDTVDYLVVAGGGAGASTYRSGGGGAGGVRFSATTYCEPSPATPLKAPAALPVSVTAYPITVGAGSTKAHITSPPDSKTNRNPNGSPSIFSTITSAGGGSGGEYPGTPPAQKEGGPGGSAGGGNGNPDGPGPRAGGTGNTPPVSPPQGNNGGAGGIAPESPVGGSARSGGGGGGALAVGNAVSPAPNGDGGPGGNGITLNINASCTSYGGGGGGGSYAQPYPTAPAPGGTGGGGAGAGRNASTYVNNSTSGSDNTGGGGGGNSAPDIDTTPGPGVSPGNGGSGIVIIRYKFQ